MTCSIIRDKQTNEIKRVLAPNGKDSILFDSIKNLGFSKEEALRYWAQVYTPSFKAWFGDWENDPANASKVVDENGEPLVVYHVGPRKIEEFAERADTILGTKPIFFTPEKNYTYYFLHRNRSHIPELIENAVIYSAFLNIVNPKYLGKKMYYGSVGDTFERNTLYDGIVGVEGGTGATDITDVEDWKEFDEVYRRKAAFSIAVRRANQVKSVTNQGTFDPTTTKLQFAGIPYISESLKAKSPELERDDVTNKYKHKPSGDTLDSVTSYLTNFQTKPLKTDYDVATAAADAIWKEVPHDVKKKVKEFSSYGEIDYDSYILLKKASLEKFIARAEIYHLMFHKEFSQEPGIADQIRKLMDTYEITDGEIGWLTEKDLQGVSQIQKILVARTGTDFYSDKPRDKIVTEIQISSAILGLAGRIDLMIDHGDNIISLYDIKTGYGISHETQNYLFKYGDTFGKAIWDNALNRAKLQIMMYAIILKAQNPELKFRQLKVLHIPSEADASENSLKNEVDPVAFLEIIEKYYKNEQPEQYKALIEANPDIFKPEHYQTVDAASVQVTTDTQDPAMELKYKILELQELVMYDKHIVEKTIQGDRVGKEARQRTKRIEQLMGQIIKMKKDTTMSLASWDTDMQWLDTWIGSASYSTNPYVQLYYKMLTDAKQKVRNDYEPWRRKFDKLLEAALREIGINPKPATKLIGGPDSNVLFEKFVKSNEYNEERFIVETDEEWNTLGSAQQELLKFILNSNDYFFVDTENHIAMANKVITYKTGAKGKKIPVTNLGLFNKELRTKGLRKKGEVTQWFRGFLPKGAPLLEDITREHGWLSSETARFLWHRYATNFFESTFDGWNNTTEAIPLKGLGTATIVANKNYSRNLEYVIDGFVKQNYYKEHLDQVYAFGSALQIYLKLKEQAAENIVFKNTIDWFEDSLNLHILGRKDVSNNWLRRTPKVNTVSGYADFNFTKFLRSLKGFFVAPTMWLKPITGLPNGVFASLVTVKEAVKNSFFMKGQHANFGINDLREGFAVAIGMQTAGAVGNLRENKAYLLMEKYGYMPDNYDWFTRDNELLTARNKIFSSKSMMFFHTMPEEVVATAIFVAQLKSMKLADGSSMWDHYNEVKNEAGEVIGVEWDGTVRGRRNISNIEGAPQYEEVKGLEIEELNAIKFLYEKLHGGYRLDERVRLEYYVLGEMLLQFRKFMPGVLKNIGASRGYRNTQGFFKEEKDADGNVTLKWTPQVVEGRWRLLAGLMLNYIGLKRKMVPEGEKGNKLMQFLGLQQNDSYNWDSLEPAQKEDLKDFMLTWLTLLVMFLGYQAAWEDGEEDLTAKLYIRIMRDLTITSNPLEVIRNSTAAPVSWEKSKKLAESSVDLSLSLFLDAAGYDDKALTKEGNYRGWKEFERNLPFLASVHSIQKAATESETLDELLLKLK